MVTHNPDLAKDYANRIIEFKDGTKISDSNPVTEKEKDTSILKIKKTAMNFRTALKLSFNNIKTKKGRTLLTAFASSIGIIGIALILSLSNGFKIEVDNFEKNTLSQAPVIISTQAMTMSEETVSQIKKEDSPKYPKEEKVYALEDVMETVLHTNILSDEYIEYVKKLDTSLLSGVSYQQATNFNIITKAKDGYKLVADSSNWILLPTNPNKNENGIIYDNYDILAGEINENEPGLILQVNSKNQIYQSTLEALGLSGKEVSFEDILNQELKVVGNDDYYLQYGSIFVPNQNLEKLYQNKNNITLKVQAIIRGKSDKEMITNGSGIGYTNALTELVISKNKDSKIVSYQEKSDYNILTNQPFDEKDGSMNTKEIMLGYLGKDVKPNVIYLYPKDFESKKEITTYLDKYNEGKEEKDVVEYTDMAAMISTLSGNIMDAITVVLVAFSSISLIVSSIMIAIITYISVLERIKEIGILRALGARRKDIKRVFNAETFIIGLTSGILGILIAYLLTIPANQIIENLSGLAGVAKLNIYHAIILVIINIILTMIGGAIPSRMASKKDPVEALRTE